MVMRINQNIVAKAGKCDCGGDIDCFRDIEVNKWYAQCQSCGHIGRHAVDWRRALARFRQTARKSAYDSQGRLKYSPELHENHGKPYTTKELAYICAMHGSMSLVDIGLAVGRTSNAVAMQLSILRKRGQFEHYRKLGAIS